MFEQGFLTPNFDGRRPDVSDPAPGPHSTAKSVGPISLAPAEASDEAVLYQTFASTRAEEMALTGWNVDQQEAFLRMQYEAQRRSYRNDLPDAEYSVIRCDGTAAGRLILDRTPEEIHVVDIALLPDFRGQGIGSTLMKAIMEEAAHSAKTVDLHVERFNPALRWYESLGFSVVDSGPIYLKMAWRPGSLAFGGPNRMASESRPAIDATGNGEAYVNSTD